MTYQHLPKKKRQVKAPYAQAAVFLVEYYRLLLEVVRYEFTKKNYFSVMFRRGKRGYGKDLRYSISAWDHSARMPYHTNLITAATVNLCPANADRYFLK